MAATSVAAPISNCSVPIPADDKPPEPSDAEPGPEPSEMGESGDFAVATAVASGLAVWSWEYQSPLAPGEEKLNTVPASVVCGVEKLNAVDELTPISYPDAIKLFDRL